MALIAAMRKASAAGRDECDDDAAVGRGLGRMVAHPRVRGCDVGATLSSLYAVPESALGVSGVWEREDWCRALWMTPKVPSSRNSSNDKRNPTEPFCVATTYVHEGGARWVHFPRAIGLAIFGPPARDVRTEGAPISDAIEFVGTLLTHPVPQVAAVNAMVHALTKTNTRMGCAVMRCGFGKTVCAVAVIARLRRKTVILVHTKQLAEQWCDRIGTFLPAARVRRHERTSDDMHDADIIIVIVQTAMRQETMTDVGLDTQQYGLVIVDETHHIAARVYSRALRMFPAAAVLGLTATPQRSDGLERYVYWLVGDPCFVALESDYREETVGTLARVTLPPNDMRAWPAHLRARAGPSAYAAAERVTDGMVARLTTALGNNDAYARAIARDVIAKHAQNGRHILVMSTRRAQLMLLARWMRSEAARSGCLAHVGRGLVYDPVTTERRVQLQLEIDQDSSLAPPLRDVQELVRTARARLSRADVPETWTRTLRPTRTKRARLAAAAGHVEELCLRVRALRIDHGIGGDLCVGIVPDADNLLVVIKDWDRISLVIDGGDAWSNEDDDDDDDDDAPPRAAGRQQRMRMIARAQYPPIVLRSNNAPNTQQMTDREVLHGACGLHRHSEQALQSLLCAYGVLRCRKALPRTIVDRIVALAVPTMRIGFCVGSMASQRWKPQLDCNILLSTSQQCAEGFDDPKRDTLIMTLPPRGNLKQLFGRVQRPCPVKQTPTRLILYHHDDTDTLFRHKVNQWAHAVRNNRFDRATDDHIVVN